MYVAQTKPNLLLSPTIPEIQGIGSIALTTIIMAHSTIFGLLAIVAFYALWLPLLATRSRQIFLPAAPLIPLFLLPLLCTYSVFWSWAPGRSLYFGIQFTSMVLCTVIIARTVSISALIKGVSAGCTAVILAAILSNRYITDFATGQQILQGYFSSKNQIGLFSTVGIYCALLMLFIPQPIVGRILLGAIPILVDLAGLYLSKSASSLVSLSFVVAMTLAAYLVTRLDRGLRPILLAMATMALILGAIVINIANINLQGEALQSLGKDSTLTGRTYLWSQGIKAGMQHPWLGWGYSGFWAQGQPLAEQYWSEFGIAERNGFHFHNIYIQTFVDTGLIGLLLIICIMLLNLGICLKRLLTERMTIETAFAFGFAFLFFIRGFVEVDFLGQYSIGTLLAFIVVPLLSRQLPADQKANS